MNIYKEEVASSNDFVKKENKLHAYLNQRK